ncbi:MAG: SprT-like domain-containing protein [Planctomycetota bacterium]
MDLVELEQRAHDELQRHGLKGWTFGWATTRRRLGACNYRLRRIEISKFYASHNSREKVIDTLLHEIAHALAGPRAKHGPIWKKIAAQLGAQPAACEKDPDTVLQPGNWRATCDGCGHVFERYRRPNVVSGYRCRCRTGSVLRFEYVGDPAKKPSTSAENRLVWEAICSGCQTVHQRIRQPRRGVWRCRCSFQCELKWFYREPSGSDGT